MRRPKVVNAARCRDREGPAAGPRVCFDSHGVAAHLLSRQTVSVNNLECFQHRQTPAKTAGDTRLIDEAFNASVETRDGIA